MAYKVVSTKPFLDQKLGTSGLRKKTKIYMQEHYFANYIQSIITVKKALDLKNGVTDSSMCVGGDGRHFCKEAVIIAIKMLIANGFKKIYVAKDGGLCSTPAFSHLIIKNKASGGILLTASHNPGGIDGDFGARLQLANGSGALDDVTDLIYAETKKITEYKIEDISDNDVFNHESVQIVDPLQDYANLQESLFDFPAIRELFKSGFTMKFDAMNAISGPYANEIFVNRLGASKDSIVNNVPLEDFGGLHPEPNPYYAKELYDSMMLDNATDFGCACDGDGDRNMVMGKGIFVNPSDSLAIIAKYFHLIPAYKDGLIGVARTKPTSCSVDLVAKSLGVRHYQTPTGFKYFSSLLDSKLINLCGEESFGIGSNHIGEKDGIWGILCWLNILAKTKLSVKDLMMNMWQEHGRVFFTQYNYDVASVDVATALVNRLENLELNGKSYGEYSIIKKQIFNYISPVDKSEVNNQGIEILISNNIRLFIRLSGTGTEGATLRFYVEHFVNDESLYLLNSQEFLKNVVKMFDEIIDAKGFLGIDAKKIVSC